MPQWLWPWPLVLRKGHTLGSLQQAPQWTHRPRRRFETGSTDVNVRLTFAAHVFFRRSTIPDTRQITDSRCLQRSPAHPAGANHAHECSSRLPPSQSHARHGGGADVSGCERSPSGGVGCYVADLCDRRYLLPDYCMFRDSLFLPSTDCELQRYLFGQPQVL